MNAIYPENIRAKAEQHLLALNALKGQPAWKHYLLPRLAEHEESALQAMLEDDIDANEREIRHRIWRAIQAMAKFPETDERSARSIVNS